MFLFNALAMVAFLNVVSATTEEIRVNHMDTMDNCMAANGSESYDIVQQLRLYHYQYKYDTVSGRVHLGVIGKELESLLPDGLKVLPRYAVHDPASGKEVVLRNYYVIDKDTLFMHNLAATQVVMKNANLLQDTVSM